MVIRENLDFQTWIKMIYLDMPRFLNKSLFLVLFLFSAVGFLNCSPSKNSEGSPSDTNNTLVSSVVVTTDKGQLQGTQNGLVMSYKGIPYARPPVGNLRWKAPEAHPGWTGIRDASQFGSHCAQTALTSSHFAGSEDCLFLNIWTRSTDPTRQRPVIVYIHGGGNTTGHGDIDYSRFISQFDAVVVSLNYRLGPFGFFSHPLLAQEDPHGSTGNYAIMDQILALKWIQKNIAAFGGDPQRVLLSGQSAGSHNTSVLLASPQAQNLFQRALLISETWFVQPPVVVDNTSKVAVRFLGCESAPDPLICLRNATTGNVASVPGAGGANATWDSSCADVNLGCRFHLASVDGYILPQTPEKLARSGLQNKVPVMVGTTSAEWTTIASVFGSSIKTDADYLNDLKKTFSLSKANAIYTLYPSSAYESPLVADIIAVGDVFHQCATRSLLDDLTVNQVQPIWQYVWAHTWEQGPNHNLGPGHGTDLPFHFLTYNENELSLSEKDLAKKMAQAIYNFASNGTPEGSGITWPSFTKAQPDYKIWETVISKGTAWREQQCLNLKNAGFDWEFFPTR